MATDQSSGLERPRQREVEITDEELKDQVEDGVELIDLNSERNLVKPTTWHQ